MVIYKIFQEALTNIARHAGVCHVSVAVFMNRDTITLLVEDNSKGIAQDKIKSVTSLGLIGMCEQAGAIGGRVDVRNRNENKGTVVRLEIPEKY